MPRKHSAHARQFCVNCHKPLAQPEKGGRPKKFCNGVCRVTYHRNYERWVNTRRVERQGADLRYEWRQAKFDQKTTELLNEVLKASDPHTARLATEAIVNELQVRAGQHEQASKKRNKEPVTKKSS
jgi:hypothetical protein